MSDIDRRAKLSHVTSEGEAQMVDVSEKPVSKREARASAKVRCSPSVLEMMMGGALPKGDALATARVAAIAAAKRTADLIPLCHPLSLDWVEIAFRWDGPDTLHIDCTARAVGRTGVEMEALTAASVAALTVYDMAKSADKSIELGPIRLEYKSGGISGEYRRS